MTQLFTAEYDFKTYNYLGSEPYTHWYCPVCISQHPVDHASCDHAGMGKTLSKQPVWHHLVVK
jgi:hypothetical protein